MLVFKTYAHDAFKTGQTHCGYDIWALEQPRLSQCDHVIQPCNPQTLPFLALGRMSWQGSRLSTTPKPQRSASSHCMRSSVPCQPPHGPSGGQAREHAKQTAEAAEEARRACIVDQERTRLLLAASHLRSFIPPRALTSQDRAALDGALAG